MNWRVIVSGLSVLAAGLLGLDKVVPILTTHSVGFASSSSGSVLRLRTDDGNLSCWIRVKVRVANDTNPTFAAAFASGTRLGTHSSEAPEGSPFWVLEIVKAGAPAGSCSQLSWSAGDELRISVLSPSLGTLELSDWEVYRDRGESDSRSNDLKRAIWHWASLALLLIAAVLGAYEAARKKEAQVQLTAESLFDAMAAGVEGETKAATRRMKKALRMVYLDRTSIDDALKEAGIGQREWRSAGIQFRPKLRRLVETAASLS